MNVRQTLAENPKIGVISSVAFLAIGALAIFFAMPAHSQPTGNAHTAFYSVDDGKTWFADDLQKIPPFDKGGKPAVRAYVYRGANGTEFVHHLERYTPEAHAVMEELGKPMSGGKGLPNFAAAQSASANGREVKRPGDSKWINASSREAAELLRMKDPKGGSLSMVEP